MKKPQKKNKHKTQKVHKSFQERDKKKLKSWGEQHKGERVKTQKKKKRQKLKFWEEQQQQDQREKNKKKKKKMRGENWNLEEKSSSS
jgi:hypothetical protein